MKIALLLLPAIYILYISLMTYHDFKSEESEIEKKYLKDDCIYDLTLISLNITSIILYIMMLKIMLFIFFLIYFILILFGACYDNPQERKNTVKEIIVMFTNLFISTINLFI